MNQATQTDKRRIDLWLGAAYALVLRIFMALHLDLALASRLEGARAGDWLCEFDEQLRAENMPFFKRREMLSVAKEFIFWCETTCDERFSAMCMGAQKQSNEAELWGLRERFLRERSPDRDLRHLEREQLHRFLKYLAFKRCRL